ncbi:hypothetical protein B0T22DRAFT_46629 [Podospora appendiculata]|uniref:Acetylserotonin methytransferase-like protein n=1 Tax=Podospora appendiculata TaxID=314037 RepID=A0AAE0XHQ8_9PEZI|nr:hypothetical protein B0T22DRAFT_46629 [Podospora appendiculata]
MSAPPPSGGGFSLFPNTSTVPRPPSRNQPTRPRAATPQGRPSISTEPTRAPTPQGRPSISIDTSAVPAPPPRPPPPAAQTNPYIPAEANQATPPRVARQASIRRATSVREGKRREPSNNPWQSALDARQPPISLDTTVADHPQVETAPPLTVADVPPRCETALSEARTLVHRSPSVHSRSSIAKPPIAYTPAGSSSTPSSGTEYPIRSIFPQYNHEVPLDRQDYYPTQANPVHLPQSAINRPLYSPRMVEQQPQSPPLLRSPMLSPAAQVAGPAGSTSKWPGGNARVVEPAVIPPVSTTEELRGLWKVVNGWKASHLEGRTFCMRLTADRDGPPLYTLTSASAQPFYSLRLDPTSASARVTLSRYDPNKPFKGNMAISLTNGTGTPSPRASSSSKFETKNEKHDAKHWQEVLSTALEPATRKQPPGDGLVAELWPAAAARLAADRANDATTVMLAEHECGRLVWDADSGNHFLVHPALAMPFCVTVERHAAPYGNRTEYTLEHVESPMHLGRLTRDGSGAGWLEVDTAIAAKIDAVYLVDVVVAALVLVAHADDQFTIVETFEPPPVIGDPAGSLSSSRRDKRSSRGSRASRRESKREEKERKRELSSISTATTNKKNKKKPAKTRMEQFEMDIESQTSEFGKMADMKGGGGGDKEKIPGLARGFIFLLTVTFKCMIWCVTLAFKALMAIVSGLGKCLGSNKL